MSQAKLAFYKGEGGTFNRLIRWWTGSDITHVEIIIDGVWYSSSHQDGGVRATTEISGKSGNWIIIDVPDINTSYALEAFNSADGMGYDWTGIIGSQILPFGIHWPWHYFCSELVGEMLGIHKPHRYSPHDLYQHLVNKEPLTSGFFSLKGK